MQQIIELDPTKIKIGRRMREEFSEADLERLAESIQQFGQLQPIGVRFDSDGTPVLVFGHRRLLACRKLGIKVKAVVLQSSPVFDQDLDERLVEFIENAVRKDFTPVEKAKAIKQLHEELCSKNPDWTIEKTAKVLSLTRQYVSSLIRSAEVIESGLIPDQVAQSLTARDLQTLSSSAGIAQRILRSVSKASKQKKIFEILHGDAFKFQDLGIEPHRFNAVITDPPYGVDYQSRSSTSKDHKSHFEDDFKYLSPQFIESLWDLFDQLLDPERGLVVCFCSLEQFNLHIQVAQKKGFWIYSRPLIWIKSSTGIPFQAKYSPVPGYEMFLFAKRSKDLPIYKIGRADWFNVPKPPSTERTHPTQKPDLLMQQIIEAYCFPDYKIIDPFCGSGSTLVGAFRAGCSEAIGIELNKETYELAKKRLDKILAGGE